MRLNKKILSDLKDKFQCGNNRSFKNYTGNIAYYVDKNISNKQGTTFYFTCYNSTFHIQKNGFISWENGFFLDGDFFGQFLNGKFFNGCYNGKKI